MAQVQRPNIVYIMTDDHTAQMMSCYGNSPIQTPNLDRIAQEGVRFSHSFVANSLSGPSRACMLTGKLSHKNGFTNNEHGIFDGVLHLCGINDKGPGERELMEAAENQALALLQ